MGLRKVREILNGILGRWIVDLYLAANIDIECYNQTVQGVTNESSTLKKLLTSLPIHLSEDLTPIVIRNFIKQISSSEKDGWGFKPKFCSGEDMYNAVCINMVSSVLGPYTKRYNSNDLSSSLAQTLVIQTLNMTRNLTHLSFDTVTETENSSLLASNIHHLRKLVSFQYYCHCTDHVVQQLALHCCELKQLDVRYSHAVTNDSVQHLLKLKNLSDVKVAVTSITPEFYGLLISKLPRVASITWIIDDHNIFDYVSTDQHHTITHVKGVIPQTLNLSRSFPNITKLELFLVTDDLSSLTNLKKLISLHIEKADYVKCNMQGVLQGVGHRLEELELRCVDNVNTAHIVTLCSCLDTLVLKYCTFTPLDPCTFLKPDLPHFKSVKVLKIRHPSQNEVYNRYLRFYVNLTKFVCTGVDILTDKFMTEAIQNGAFRNIEWFEVKETEYGALSMATVELLLNNCECLKTLGKLRSWRRLTPQGISDLKSRVSLHNLDLNILP